MGDIVQFPVKGKFDIVYVTDEDDEIVGITRDDWGFRIQRNGSQIAFVSEADDQPFGELDAKVFNTILGCWLMIDDVETLKSASEGLHDV